MNFLDYVGRQILIGDCVAFPRRQGSKMWLAKMIVTSIGQKVRGYLPDHPGKREARLSPAMVRNCLVIIEPASVSTGLGALPLVAGAADGNV